MIEARGKPEAIEHKLYHSKGEKMENIFQKRFDDISEVDIQNLIDTKYEERQTIDYKKETYGGGDAAKKEMLKDISSFANAQGGYLIIGVEDDKNGIPIKVNDIEDAEKERERIERSYLSNFEPRVSGLKSKVIKTNKGENIILFLIPNSFRKPHMITFQGLNQFWIRHNKNKFLMSIEEIRESCSRTENIWKNIRDFLDEREKEIIEEIADEPCFVIGSSTSILNENIVDIRDVGIRDFLNNPPGQTRDCNLNFRQYGSLATPTLFGLKIGDPNDSSIELFRNGYYELKIFHDFISSKIEGEFYFLTPRIISWTINYYRAVAKLAEILGISQTIITFLSIFNIQNIILKEFIEDPIWSLLPTKKPKWPKKHLKITPRQIFSLDNPDIEAKRMLDLIWNAFRFEKAPEIKLS